MYQRRTLGVVAAIVLALLGTLGLVGYVQGAKDRAVAGEKLVTVYVANDKIAAGTPLEKLTSLVTTEKVPAKVRATDAVARLKSMKGKVTSIELVKGEQIVASRFVAATAATKNAKGVPAGFFGASFALDPELALGGQIRAGDHVAIVGTIAGNGTEADTSAVIAGNVLVTSVQIDGSNGDNPKRREVTAAPTGKFFVTFALTEADLAKVVASANSGRMWLAENPQAGPTQ